MLVPPIEGPHCHLWWAEVDDVHPPVGALLGHEERRRVHSIRQASRRKGFILGCAVTRLAVSGYGGRSPQEVVISRACSTCGRPHGRPRVTPGTGERAVEISVSHSQRLVGVAVAEAARLGIDLERVDADLDVGRLAELVLRPAEIAALQNGDETGRTRRFLRYWTRKEAALKAIGCGLQAHPKHIAVSPPDEPPRVTVWDPDPSLPGRIFMHDIDPGERYVASLAVVGEQLRPVALDGTALVASWCRDRLRTTRLAGHRTPSPWRPE